MTTPPPPLVVSGLTKSYRRRPVLRAVDLSVMAGEAVAVIGPNGAGKSTFLGCLVGERLPDSGSIRICGADPFSDPRHAARCIGFVPEQPFLYGELTAGETLRFVAAARRLDPSAASSEMQRLLELFGLAEAEDTLCRELSQGMARKVAIIAALLHQPTLLVLDEVYNGLDQTSAERLQQELADRRAGGAAVLLSSHDLGLLARSCDRGLLLAPTGYEVLDGDRWREWAEQPRVDAVPSRSTE